MVKEVEGISLRKGSVVPTWFVGNRHFNICRCLNDSAFPCPKDS